MARPVGSINEETIITIPIKPSYIMTARGKRYVFMAHVQPKVYEAACKTRGGRTFYDRFSRAMRAHLYNTVTAYGLEAVNVDEPQLTIVSVRLKFVITEDEDELNNVAQLTDIKVAKEKHHEA